MANYRHRCLILSGFLLEIVNDSPLLLGEGITFSCVFYEKQTMLLRVLQAGIRQPKLTFLVMLRISTEWQDTDYKQCLLYIL